MKPIFIMEAALARRLRFRADLYQLGIRVERSSAGGVILSKDGLCLGRWHWRPRAFTFELVGAGRPITAQTIMGAAAFTASILDDSN